MAKRSTRTMGETVACRRLIACPAWLSHQSKTAKERNPVVWDLRIISTKSKESYIPTSPQEFYKFILSIHPLARKKRREEERTRPEEIRARCALCKPRRERYTLAREISQRLPTCNRGRPRPIIRWPTASRNLTCTSQGPGENELQARRKD